VPAPTSVPAPRAKARPSVTYKPPQRMTSSTVIGTQ
jgi:hypothetical protein